MEFKLFNPSTWGQKNQQVTTYNSRITNNAVTFMGADGNAYVKDGPCIFCY
jgi:hypothetical protein